MNTLVSIVLILIATYLVILLIPLLLVIVSAIMLLITYIGCVIWEVTENVVVKGLRFFGLGEVKDD